MNDTENRPKNGLDLLKADHQKIYELFDQREQTSDQAQKRDLFDLIREELAIHAEMEKSAFYPDFEQRKGFEDMIEDAYDVHQEMKDLINEIEASEDEDEIEDLIDELRETFESHVEEEENELFDRVRRVSSDADLERLESRLEETKRRAQEAA